MVADNECPDQEPLGGSGNTEPEQVKSRFGRQAFTSLRRELSDDELASPGVQKMLLAEIERLEAETAKLGSYQDKFYIADKKATVLEEKNKVQIAHEIITLSCITLGGVSLGYAPAVWSYGSTGFIAIAVGAILIICGIVSKAVKS